MVYEELQLYKIASSLVQNGNYEVIHYQDNADEIWLERYENKISTIIRLIPQGFNWKNHLKRDIAITFQRAKSLTPFITSKRVEICNVYIASYAPVDDWEGLKKPIQLKEKQPMKMKVYYIDAEEGEVEQGRLFSDLDIAYKSPPLELPDDDLETRIGSYKTVILQSLKQKKEEITNIFSYGKPLFTYLFIAINVAVFLLMELYASGNEIETLIDFGAKYNVAIIEGSEWWRLFTSMFIHIGFLHLFMNMIAIYYLGIVVEKIFGSFRFFIIYLLSGIGGSIASFAFSANISAGASGAIFGLFGSLLIFGIYYKRVFLKTMGLNLLFVLLINIVIGLFIPQIDMAAHLGGLAAGLLAAQVIHLPNKKNYLKQAGTAVICIGLFVGFIIFGLFSNEKNQTYQLMKIEELMKIQDYENIIDAATTALNLSGEHDGSLLFHRSYAYIELGQFEKAIEDLENSLSYEVYPESYYNLSILYMEKGEDELARQYVEKAYQMNPTNESFIHLYEEITGEKVSEE